MIIPIKIPTIDVIKPAVAVPGFLPSSSGFCKMKQTIPAILKRTLPQQQHPVTILTIPRINDAVAMPVEVVVSVVVLVYVSEYVLLAVYVVLLVEESALAYVGATGAE